MMGDDDPFFELEPLYSMHKINVVHERIGEPYYMPLIKKGKKMSENKETRASSSDNLVAYLNEHATTITGLYYNQAQEKYTGTPYTFRVTKEFANQLNVADLVIVQSQAHYNVVQVSQIHGECEIERDNTHAMKWVVGKVNLDDVNRMKAIEADLKKAIQRTEVQRVRKKAIEDAGLDTSELQSILKIASTAEEFPPAPPPKEPYPEVPIC